jgi:hypothetical protein
MAKLSERGHLEDVGVDGSIILILILMWWEGVGWFNLPRNIEKNRKNIKKMPGFYEHRN